jgi:hypothetical protein
VALSGESYDDERNAGENKILNVEYFLIIGNFLPHFRKNQAGT